MKRLLYSTQPVRNAVALAAPIRDDLRPVPYQETDHYRITKSFLDKPERMLRELMT